MAYARYNKRLEKVSEAILQFATTIFTCFVLTAASIIFSNDAERIMIKPIQKIIMIIQRLAENPLKKPEPPKKDDTIEKSQMKTQMLELTIFKISTLLQRGFGELGAKVVASTLTNNEDFMDVMVPGQKMQVIFSVCRIRQFTETTESLQDEIIVFVNKIVKIIHEIAKRWDGMPAKNYGERYLLIWKLPTANDKDGITAALEQNRQLALLREFSDGQPIGNQSTFEQQFNLTGKIPDVGAALLQNDGNEIHEESAVHLNEMEAKAKLEEDLSERRQIVADKALISAVKIVVELRRAQDLQAYSRHPKIAPKFGPNYRTGVTFGLHVGWAIEGAIGSDFKIDALHLSPDSSIAHRIEQFCQVYETQVLVTQDLQRLLSERGKTCLRLIDNVVMNESRTPKELYSFDIKFVDQIDNLPLSKQEEDLQLGALIKHQEYENNPPPADMFKGDNVDHMYVIDHDFYTLRKLKKDSFENNYRQAYLAYITGDWNSAQNYLTQCLEMNFEDGPCLALSEFMEKHKFAPPDGWLGYRDLDEKDQAPSMSFIKAGFEDDGGEEEEDLEDDDSLS